jgi:hypothetical protein
MSSTAGAGGEALDATVRAGQPVSAPDQDALEREVAEAASAVEIIARKLEGWKQSLADAEARLEVAAQALRDAKKGDN